MFPLRVSRFTRLLRVYRSLRILITPIGLGMRPKFTVRSYFERRPCPIHHRITYHWPCQSWRSCATLYYYLVCTASIRLTLLIFVKTFVILAFGLIRVQTPDQMVAIKASFLCTFRARRKIVQQNVSTSLVNSISLFPCLWILSVGTVRAKGKERKKKVGLKSYQRQTAVDKTFTETPGSPRHRVPKH